MEDVGGEINAYTTKEETVIHSTFFREYYMRALELFSDIAFHSVFPSHELRKEKEIILDEINSYKDSPSELIFDEFEELLFDGNPLGRNILGTESILKTFQPADLKTFIANNYSSDQMVVSSVGNIGFAKLVKMFETLFGAVGMKNSGKREMMDCPYEPVVRRTDRKTYQAHCIIGNLAYDIRHKKRLTLALLNNVLGGPGLNTRLNLALRERKGLAYAVDSLYTPYTDTGNITIYFGSDKSQVDACIRVILKELRTIRSKPLSHGQLLKAKRQIMGQIAIASENNENHMLSMGKSIMIFGKFDSLEETGRKIEAITDMQLLEVANEVLDPERLSYLIYE
jgi:predicted Zn-dependent peptidase